MPATVILRIGGVILLTVTLSIQLAMTAYGQAASTADLSVSMVPEKRSLKFGDSMTLTTTATNNGPDTATGVTLSLGVSDSFANFGGTCPDGTVSSFCDIGTLLPGASVTVEFLVGACCQCCPDFVGVSVASVGHDANTVDPNETNNSFRTETRLKGRPPF